MVLFNPLVICQSSLWYQEFCKTSFMVVTRTMTESWHFKVHQSHYFIDTMNDSIAEALGGGMSCQVPLPFQHTPGVRISCGHRVQWAQEALCALTSPHVERFWSPGSLHCKGWTLMILDRKIVSPECSKVLWNSKKGTKTVRGSMLPLVFH